MPPATTWLDPFDAYERDDTYHRPVLSSLMMRFCGIVAILRQPTTTPAQREEFLAMALHYAGLFRA